MSGKCHVNYSPLGPIGSLPRSVESLWELLKSDLSLQKIGLFVPDNEENAAPPTSCIYGTSFQIWLFANETLKDPP